MKKNLKKVLATMLIPSFMLASFPTVVSADDVTSSNSNIQVIKVSENEERIIIGNTTVIDSTDEFGRTITTYDESGTSVYYDDFSTGIATLSVDGKIIETYDNKSRMEETETWSIPESDKLLLEEYLKNYSSGAKTVQPLPEGLQYDYEVSVRNNTVVIEHKDKARASMRTVKAYSDVTSTYPSYYYKTIGTNYPYSTICNRTLTLKVKDSMYGYVSENEKAKRFYAGATFVDIMDWCHISFSSLTSSLGSMLQMINGVYTLVDDVYYYFKEDYDFYALRQGYVYDYTNLQRDVSVDSKTGSGRVSMTWDFVNGEYVNPQWKMTAQAYPFTISQSTMFSEAKRIWESNIQEYGYWKWGDV